MHVYMQTYQQTVMTAMSENVTALFKSKQADPHRSPSHIQIQNSLHVKSNVYQTNSPSGSVTSVQHLSVSTTRINKQSLPDPDNVNDIHRLDPLQVATISGNLCRF